VLWLLALVPALLMVLGYLLLPYASRTDAARRFVVGLAARASYGLEVESMRLGHDLELRIEGLSLAASDREPFLSAESVRVRLAPVAAVLRGRIVQVVLHAPHVFPDRLPHGGSAAERQARADLRVDDVVIEDGYVHYETEGGPIVIGPFEVDLDSVGTSAGYSLGGQWRSGEEAALEWSLTMDDDFRAMDGRGTFVSDDVSALVRSTAGIDVPVLPSGSRARGEISFHGDLRDTLALTARGWVESPDWPSVQLELDGRVQPAAERIAMRGQVTPAGLPPVRIEAETSASGGSGAPEGELSVIGDAVWEANAEDVTKILPRLFANAGVALAGRVRIDVAARGAATDPQLEGSVLMEDLSVTDGGWTLRGDARLPFHGAIDHLTLTPGAAAQGLALSAPGWEGKLASVELSGDALLEDGRPARAALDIGLRGFGLHDADYLRAVEGLEGTVRLARKNSGDFDLSLHLPRGELLWNRLFVDLAAHPLVGQLAVSSGSEDLRVESGEIGLGGVGRASLGGTTVRAGAHQLQLDFDVTDVAAAYRLAVRDPLQQSYAVLGGSELTGGLEGRMAIVPSAQGLHVLRGRLRFHGGQFRTADPVVELRDIHADVPVALGKTIDGSDLSERGEIRIGHIRTGKVSIPDGLYLPMSVRPDRIHVDEPVAIGVLGGSVVVTGLDTEVGPGVPLRAHFGLSIDGIALDELAEAMSWPTFTGSVTGAIPSVTVTAEEIATDGQIQMSLFDGTVRIDRVRMGGLGSSVPALELDLEFHRLSLTALTGVLPIGQISGTMEGAVRNLSIVDGQPVAFDAWMETVPSDEPQRISVAAIRKISILGSGADPFFHGILGFFDEYRYAKMGFRCRLRNDVFTLEGVETRDGKEYLVVGTRLPPQVNVISHNQRIAFSEMMRRLQRLGERDSSPKEEGT